MKYKVRGSNSKKKKQETNTKHKTQNTRPIIPLKSQTPLTDATNIHVHFHIQSSIATFILSLKNKTHYHAHHAQYQCWF
jgi:hypothetical protein